MSDVPPPPPPPPGSPPPRPPAVPPIGPGPGGLPPYGAVLAYRPEVRYAGWWRRVGAAIIDGLIGLVFALPGVIALFVGPTEIETCTINGEFRLCEVPTGGTIGIAVLLYAIGIIGYIAIYCVMQGKGATVGRKAAGYRVLDERSLEPIGTGRAVGRYFATILSAMPCYLGFLWPLWDAENRTFHDMIMRTRAVVD